MTFHPPSPGPPWPQLEITEQRGEGCHIWGTLLINKVAGNFHFAPGRSYQQGNMHIHDLSPFSVGGWAGGRGGCARAPGRAGDGHNNERHWPCSLPGCSVWTFDFSHTPTPNPACLQHGETFDFSHTIHNLAFGEPYPGEPGLWGATPRCGALAGRCARGRKQGSRSDLF